MLNPATRMIKFNHEHFVLDEKRNFTVSRKAGHISPQSAEEINVESLSVVEALATYVQVNHPTLLSGSLPRRRG